ncbi:MAG: hypothetical protein V4528_14650 [Pseudomonadota bacterium]
MSGGYGLVKALKIIGLVWVLGVSMNAEAGLFGFGGTSWKEEALQNDGSKIIVERSIRLGGRHEIGQEPSIREQSLVFIMPNTHQRVSWKDEYSADLGTANFLPMQLEVAKNTAYLVASPMGCLSYNKWGRPNPPYVVFKYQDKAWKRIPLQELPIEFKQINLAFSSPDHAAKEANHGLLSAEQIKKWNSDAQQPQYKSILREPLPQVRINEMCEERILYKGNWILPNDPIARKFIDQQNK